MQMLYLFFFLISYTIIMYICALKKEESQEFELQQTAANIL